MLMTESNKYDIKELNEMVESSNLKLEHAIRQMDMVGRSHKLNEKKKKTILPKYLGDSQLKDH